MTDLHEKFTEYLLSQKQRYTTQRKDIVTAILEKKDHFEIDEFISEVHLQGKRLARATVYRTVKQLLDANLIQKIDAGNGRIYYEYNEELEHHDHMICNQCGKILEIKNNTIEKAIKSECRKLDFQPEYRSLHIYGTCKNCN
ncbi:transcriptional repressor [Candidatus Marinamargulisbacteria bacterium SCGC AG-343-K17]|nr:transcriptional repressor [Candidatus Marinamargulisbacteria bacterium SCGC AG-343-K17]